jgi:hypothetical protein
MALCSAMKRRAATLVSLFLLSCFSFGQGYYSAIQKSSHAPIDPKQFRALEESALKQPASADSYEKLATAFSGTTERMWAIIYSEVACNLSNDSKLGTTIFDLYQKALTVKGNSLSVNLTESAEAPKNGGAPIESQYEMALVFAAAPNTPKLSALTIATLSDIRQSQLSLLNQKKLFDNQFSRWLTSMAAAGHFEAYNYWLFQQARPDEFKAWLETNKTKYDAWIAWREKNSFKPTRPDFQRLYLLKG